jgi:predicted PurR-regulated permease PerM
LIWVCLFTLGVNNSLSISLLAGICGNIPVVGTGLVFIPWLIYLFIVGDIPMAIWILTIMGSNVLKHIIEPKIIGDTLGVSAFTMLSFMIVSLELFGVAGVILAPFLVIILKSLYQRGLLQKLVRIPDDF